MCPILSYQNIATLTPVYPKVSLLLYYMCAKRIKFLMTRLSVCGLGVSCNEMSDTPMLLVVQQSGTLLFCSCHGIAGFLVDELQI